MGTDVQSCSVLMESATRSGITASASSPAPLKSMCRQVFPVRTNGMPSAMTVTATIPTGRLT